MNGLLGFPFVIALAGCAGNGPNEAPLVPATRIEDPAERSSEAIAGERCDREARCGTLGPGQPYESRTVCMRKLRDAAYARVGPASCRSGIESTALRACVLAIRDAQCDVPIYSLDVVAACRSGALCVP